MTRSSTGASKEALFCIGSNCGDRKENVANALRWLRGILMDGRNSPIYATPDCHGGQREYMNAVVAGTTFLAPEELERICKDYEIGSGRDSAARAAGNVPVDVDLVVYDGCVLRDKDFRCEFFLKGYRILLDNSH